MGAAFGAAGQRCMALSTAVFVGEAKEWIPEIVERAKQLKVNAGVCVCVFVCCCRWLSLEKSSTMCVSLCVLLR